MQFKRKLALVTLLLLISCSPSRTYLPGYTQLTALDLSKYSKKGFLITPYQYDGDYESIGFLNAVAMPPAKLTTVGTGKKTGGGIEITKKEWKIAGLNLEELIDQFYQKAHQMGADAIVEFKMTETRQVHEQGSNKPVTIVGVNLSGFAIKRRGAFK